MKVIVHNKQQYAIGRGGHVFPPGEDTEVFVGSRAKLREISACVYLNVRPAGDGEPDDGHDAVIEVTLAEALDGLTRAELTERAGELGVEVPSRATKPQIIGAILAAAESAATEAEGQEGERPPFDAWGADALADLAAEWGLDVPDDASHGDLLDIVRADYEQRQQADAPELETG